MWYTHTLGPSDSPFLFSVFNTDMHDPLTHIHTYTETHIRRHCVITTNQRFGVCKCQVISVLQSPPV